MNGREINAVMAKVASLLGEAVAWAFEACVQEVPLLEQATIREHALSILELQVGRLKKTKPREWMLGFRKVFAMDAVYLAYWGYYGGMEGIRRGRESEARAFWMASEFLFREAVARKVIRWLEGQMGTSQCGDIEDHVMRICELAEDRFLSKVRRGQLKVADIFELKAFVYGPLLEYSLRDYKKKYGEEMRVAEAVAREKHYHEQAVIDGLADPFSKERPLTAEDRQLRRGEVAIAALVEIASKDPAVFQPWDPKAFLKFLETISRKDGVGQVATAVLEVLKRFGEKNIEVVLARLRTNPPAPHREVAAEVGVTLASCRKIYSRVLQSVEAQLESLVRDSVNESRATEGKAGGID